MDDLMVTDFAKYIIGAGEHPAGIGGQQMKLRFPNSFGASIIQTPFSYGADEGRFEMAVLYFPTKANDYELTYDTEITDDVLGHLTPNDCLEYLAQVQALPPGRPVPREDRHCSADVDELLDSLNGLMSAGAW